MADPEASKSISGELPIRPATTDKQDGTVQSNPKVTGEALEEQLKADAPVKTPQPTSKAVSSGPANAMEEQSLQQIVSSLKKRKHKNRRPRSKRGLGKPTGFEPWSCDGPLTKDVVLEDRERYDQARPFISRIEEAAIRFEKDRRIESDRRHVFHKYLAYGGISTDDNYCGGVSAQDLKEMNEQQAMRARTKIGIHKERETMEVNFNLVVRGYLGAFHGHYFSPATQKDIELATVTISNFLTYLLFHDVCPEYEDDILRARETCERASKDLWTNLQLLQKSPGNFNKACSSLFGGFHFNSCNEHVEWNSPGDNEMTDESARQIMKYGITFGAAYEVYERFKEALDGENGNLSVCQVLDIDGFEIVSVEDPAPHVLVNYEKHAPGHIPLGIIHAKSFKDPGKPDIDLSSQERWDWEHGKSPNHDFTFLIEVDILKFCYPGQKILTTVWELSCGLHYFDRMTMIYPEFYESLYNDRMLQWKAPKEIPRPVPSPGGVDSTDVLNEVAPEASHAAVPKTNETPKPNEQKKHFEDSDIEFDF